MFDNSDQLSDKYECNNCENTVLRQIVPNNIINGSELFKYCPFCGEEYDNERKEN